MPVKRDPEEERLRDAVVDAATDLAWNMRQPGALLTATRALLAYREKMKPIEPTHVVSYAIKPIEPTHVVSYAYVRMVTRTGVKRWHAVRNGLVLSSRTVCGETTKGRVDWTRLMTLDAARRDADVCKHCLRAHAKIEEVG